MRRGVYWFVATLLPSACAPVPPPALPQAGEPIAQQLLEKAPFLRDARYSTLLDFESPEDALFVAAGSNGGASAVDRAFTGHGSYRIAPATSQCSIKLASLLTGRPFPATWSMIGGFFLSPQPTHITLRLASLSSDIDLPANAWTPVFLDLPANAAISSASPLQIELPVSHGPLWLDDVMLVDNEKWLVPDAADSWNIERRGTQINGTAAGLFKFSLSSADLAHFGWLCDEANPMRARFHTLDGKTLTVYSDGRAYSNGEYKPMSSRVRDPSYAQQNEHPASIEVAENMGRLDRNTAGDANNDGYNESTGSYRVIAQSPRIELRFVPAHGVPDPRPVLEISGLPFGKILATLEGRLIESSQRTNEGNVLIELPATIDRPATVDVRIEN